MMPKKPNTDLHSFLRNRRFQYNLLFTLIGIWILVLFPHVKEILGLSPILYPKSIVSQVEIMKIVASSITLTSYTLFLGIRELKKPQATKRQYCKGKVLPLILIFSMMFPVVYAYVYEQGSQSMTQDILNTNSYYDPSSDISTAWTVIGSSTHYGAIDEGIRNTSIPTLTDYIHASLTRTDEIGFPAISESGITSFILWIYSETGNNARTTIDLKNDGSIQATLTINPSSSQGWRSIEWINPSSIGSISADFLHDKFGGGATTDSTVYAAYIEVIFSP